MSPTPEQRAREDIDGALADAGWTVQDHLRAGGGTACCEDPLTSGAPLSRGVRCLQQSSI